MSPSPRTDSVPSDSDSDSGSSQGYEDVPGAEDDEETAVPAVCLFCELTLPSAHGVFAHCAHCHGFDWKTTVKTLGLDFYGRIKLINYIRTLTAAGKPFTPTDRGFDDDKFLMPVLEEDPMLFSFDDEERGDQEARAETSQPAEQKIQELEAQLHQVRLQFREYVAAASQSFARHLDEKSGSASSPPPQESGPRDDDSHYFNSYAGNDIHEIMLKDTVRTDAYRDFIYGHKDLFKGKVVLDVGCGTGVLSMFCAKAGAKKVISVDNSAIIDKARAIVFENGLDNVITCLHGKIEEVTLPVKQVDIIVSEWMGYCLLYEAMLDSVLYARDRYLAPDGLMVPSECKILVAAVHDPDYMNDAVNFWDHVYGFSMAAMKDKIRQDVAITHLPATALASEPTAFCHLPLHTVQPSDLVFTKPFAVTINEDVDSLDAFIVYFDTFFATSREQTVAPDARAESWKDPAGGVSFTTGPAGKGTHWRQGLLLVDEGKNAPLKGGQVLAGEIAYRKRKENSREVELEVSWSSSSSRADHHHKQMWIMW